MAIETERRWFPERSEGHRWRETLRRRTRADRSTTASQNSLARHTAAGSTAPILLRLGYRFKRPHRACLSLNARGCNSAVTEPQRHLLLRAPVAVVRAHDPLYQMMPHHID